MIANLLCHWAEECIRACIYYAQSTCTLYPLDVEMFLATGDQLLHGSCSAFSEQPRLDAYQERYLGEDILANPNTIFAKKLILCSFGAVESLRSALKFYSATSLQSKRSSCSTVFYEAGGVMEL